MAGTFFFIGAGRKEDRAINVTDNTPGSTRAGMIGQRPVYSDLVYQPYVHSVFTGILVQSFKRIETIRGRNPTTPILIMPWWHSGFLLCCMPYIVNISRS